MSSIMKGIVDEEVGGNYLYHATSASGLKSILQSGIVKAATGPQSATAAQTKMPTVSTTRSWGYASGSHAENQESGGIIRDAVLIFDRANIENNFKTLGTSQSRETRGTPFPHAGNLKAGEKARSYDVDNDGNLTSKDADEVFRRQTIQSFGKPASRQEVGQILGRAKKDFYYPKAGGEFEEAVVVPKGGLPIKGTLVGFWVNPESSLIKDPEIMNNPMRLEKTGPNKFAKAAQAQPMNESEEVAVIYIDGKPSAKYAKKHEAEKDAEFMRNRHPNKKIEIKQEVRETEAIKGADGKRCWKGKRYAGTENGKDKCIPVKNEAANPAQQAAIAINMKKKGKKPKNVDEGVIVGHDANDPEVAILGGAGTMSLSRLKKKAHAEALQLADDIANGKYNASSYNMKQLHNTLNTIVAAEKEMEKLYFGEDYTGEFAAEKTPEVNPYGGQRNRKFRGAIGEALLSEMPDTSGPVGTQPGGWRRTDIDEYREMSPALKAAQQNLIALRNKEKATNVPGKRERISRDKVELDKPKPASVLTKGAQEVDPDTMDAIKAFLAKGGEIKKGRPGKAPPTGRQQASKHIGGGGKYRRKSDTPGQGANYRGAAIVAVEDTAYAGGMGQGGNAGQSYRKFTPKSAGTFNEGDVVKGPWKKDDDEDWNDDSWIPSIEDFEQEERIRNRKPNIANDIDEEQLDEKCWTGYKQVGMKKKGDKNVPNCVPKESAIMKGLKR